ncbi:BQ5605_C010g06178 [Microbotryum silenes-dioicae]|uniref:ATP synthase subunit 5, mitochondrial n=1 Tax=Microbotryum silenes-dioicae TaxID=796604 RepID=A0A2X0LU18_9BASI|nr:BQ5605_C010g06178 [Microbotryum silenes-dioicae]
MGNCRPLAGEGKARADWFAPYSQRSIVCPTPPTHSLLSSVIMFARQVARQVRTYATSASTLHGLSGKYAGALFTAAAKKGGDALKKVQGDLEAVHKTITAEPTIQDFLSNPVLSSADKSKGIDELLKRSKATGSDLTKNFFEVLAENGRLYQADKTIADFLEIMSAHRGEVKVTITTAQPLERDLQKRLEDSLKQSSLAGSGKTLVIENKVNEAVLGGLIVDFDGKSVDLSVASKVNKLNATLQESV